MPFNDKIIDDLLGIDNKSIEDVIYATEYFSELIQLKFEYVIAHSDRYSTEDIDSLSTLLRKVTNRNEEARELYAWLNEHSYEPSKTHSANLLNHRQEVLLSELRRLVDNWDEGEEDF